MRRIDFIVLHTTATPQTTTIEQIQRYWKNELKWIQPGYHRVIKPNGDVVFLQDLAVPTNGVGGYNANSIHVSYIGGVDEDNKPVDNRTPEQISSMTMVVKGLKKMFPKAEILGHRDFWLDKRFRSRKANKACPCFDSKKWCESVGINPYPEKDILV